MQLGAIFPQNDIGSDSGLLRDYVQGVEALGFSHLLTYDHVLGAHPDRPGGWSGPYTHEHAFHEPLVFLAWTAALTKTLGLATGIVILPQRQTALVAKQCAEVDILSGGRLRLGVATGWNPVEYEALGEDFHTRGRRLEAQVELMRRLWTEPVVDVHDEWHSITRAGLNPLPGRLIPIWFGGMDERVLRRAARLADGWIPHLAPTEQARETIAHLHDLLRAEGRDPASFGIEGRMSVVDAAEDRLIERARRWRDLDARYLSLYTGGRGLAPHEHLAALRGFKEAWDASEGAAAAAS